MKKKKQEIKATIVNFEKNKKQISEKYTEEIFKIWWEMNFEA